MTAAQFLAAPAGTGFFLRDDSHRTILWFKAEKPWPSYVSIDDEIYVCSTRGYRDEEPLTGIMVVSDLKFYDSVYPLHSEVLVPEGL